MGIVGLDGNDAPELEQGIPSRLWYGINARAFTYRNREPGDPDYGLGLPEALHTRPIAAQEWLARLQRSFATLDGYVASNFRADLDATQVILSLDVIGVGRVSFVFDPRPDIPLPTYEFTELPKARWVGLFSPAPMRLLSDFWTEVAQAISTDFATIHPSLLAALAVELDAFAYDPEGPDSQKRGALAQAKRLHALVGTEAAFDALMAANNTTGKIRYIGDYDETGKRVPRDEDDRRKGEFSSLYNDPNDPLGDPTSPRNSEELTKDQVDTDSLTHLHIALDVVLPPDRIGDDRFLNYITAAARRTMPYTLNIAEVNIIQAARTDVKIVTNSRQVKSEYTYKGKLWR